MVTTHEFFSYIVAQFYDGSQLQAAKDLEISKSTMSAYCQEGGSEAKLSTVQRVFVKFNQDLNPDWILGLSPEPKRLSENEELERLRSQVSEMRSDFKELRSLVSKNL